MENIQFILCDVKPDLCKAWMNQIVNRLTPEEQSNFTIFNDRLDQCEDQFDCIVSPANSWARLDGSFDYHISRMFSPKKPSMVTDHCQAYLYSLFNGYQTPGTCLLIPMHVFNEKKNNCKFIAHCPTMRMPSDVRWNKEVIYNCIWNLLCELRRWNTFHADDPIRKVFLTGLATGVGMVSAETCSSQMILAYRHFLDNLAKKKKTTSWEEATAMSLS
jgi:O-acetyl-ADP-ribose deacetylase (regulator of RNase III)